MELLEIIKNRRSIRSFKKQVIPQELIEKLLEAASWAPSAGNVQPWTFVVVNSRQIKESLAAAAFGQRDVEEAPIVVVVCADEKLALQSYGMRGKTLFCLQDTAAATQNILLVAYSLGLGSCWVGAFEEDAVKQIIKAPVGMHPIALIPIGNLL